MAGWVDSMLVMLKLCSVDCTAARAGLGPLGLMLPCTLLLDLGVEVVLLMRGGCGWVLFIYNDNNFDTCIYAKNNSK